MADKEEWTEVETTSPDNKEDKVEFEVEEEEVKVQAQPELETKSEPKEEAQVLVDANIATALEEWNARPAEQKAYIPEPGPRTLP